MSAITAAAFTATGSKSAAAELDADVFGIMPENHELLKLAYTAYLANGRENHAVTKTRGLVSGGGKKPWKQKGTGRARFGSSRNPIWRGGGIAFGPTGQENYSMKVNINSKRLAIRQALSLAASEGHIITMNSLESKDGKVSTMAKLLTKIEAKGNILLVVEHKDVNIERATQNLQNVKLVQANYLNVFDVLNADTIVISSKSLDIVSNWLGGKK